MSQEITTKLDPTILVIFGITGDLSLRYLLPAIHNLISNDLVNKNTEIVGVTRGNTTVDDLFSKLEANLKQTTHSYDEAALKTMHSHTSMFQMDLEDSKGYQSLLQRLNQIEDDCGMCMNRLYYLSIPPTAYSSVIQLLGEQQLNTSCQHNKSLTRLLVEKPFGYSLTSARALIDATDKVFSKEQVFRIDHYMAKEAVQNILTFRFQNPMFETLWNNQYISQIEISAKQKIGIEGRSVFYEPLGALRDFIQNHLIQILGIVTMDMPVTLDSEPIHASKQAVLEQVAAIAPDHVKQLAVRGQYAGYKQEVNNVASTTETFAALTLQIDSPRWHGVPIKLLTGKALKERATEICITFKGAKSVPSNRLLFRIQPNEGIELDLITKKPGYDYDAELTPMDFSYQTDFPEYRLPDAYERVLVDAIRGDHSLFASSQEVLSSWRIVQPVLDAWANSSDDLIIYQPGTDGPT